MTKKNSNTPVLVEHQFNNQVVRLRDIDGYISATAMCQAVNKRMNNYLRNSATAEFLEALSADTRISASELIQTLKGGNDKQSQGTWVHPKVAIHLAQWLSPQFAVQVTNWVHGWMMGEPVSDVPVIASRPPSCLPVIHNESVVLMFYRDAEYWVSFRGLCDAARLDYKWFLRSLGYEYDAREIDQCGESVLCLSFDDALTWLRGLRPEKVQFKKRHFVVSAMLRLPELLEGARDGFERDVRSSRVCESRLVDGDYVRVHRRELSRYYSEMSRIVSGSVQEMRATTEAFECSQGIDDGAEFRVNEAREVIAGYCGGVS